MTLSAQRRTDFAKFAKPVMSPAGYLVADAYLTRSGVFEYRDANGNVTRELRHPDDVFKSESLASLALVPVTDLHPNERVDSTTARKYQRGAVGENVTRDGDYVRAKVAITDAELQGKIKGGQEELSCGYVTDIIPESGTYNGEKYDVRQTNIIYDHLASVPAGRAGREVRLRLDGAHQLRQDAGDGDHNNEDPTMKKIKVDGIEIEVTEVAAQVIEAAFSKRDAAAAQSKTELEAAKKDAGTEKGRADAAEAKLATVEKAHKDAIDPKAMNERVLSRVALEKVAEKAGVEAKTDMDDVAVKRAIVAKVEPELKLDDAHQVEGAYQFIVKQLAKKNDALDSLKGALNGGGGEPKTDAEKAHDEMVKAQGSTVDEYRKRHLARS